jgi:hypothetical protein
VINFFSGQLLQAKSPDGAQVFLQSIKIPRRPLPARYQEALRKLNHPHLAPIIDVMEEEDQLILVHPPFSGDPLPLIVNKDRPMEPETAVRIVSKCFETLNDMERFPLPLGATLDPKNILLEGRKPVLLFYYIKDPKQPLHDEKWRELLFYLLTGQHPVGGAKQWEKQLEEKLVPPKIAKLAIQCLDHKVTMQESAEALEKYLATHSREEGRNLGRGARQRRRKLLYASVSIAAAALLLIPMAFLFFDHGDSNATVDDPLQMLNRQGKEVPQDNSLVQSITFTNNQQTFTLPSTLPGDSSLRGAFVLNKTTWFAWMLESPDKVTYSVYINSAGSIELYQGTGDHAVKVLDSGSKYRIKPGKKYTFEVYYFPGEPLRISIVEEGDIWKKWMAVGTLPVNGDLLPVHDHLKVKFAGGNGATLFYPEVNVVNDRIMVDNIWMNQQPWQIDFGQAVLGIDENHLNRLEVFPKTQIRLSPAAAIGGVTLIPAKKSDPLHMDIQTVDDSRYRLVWDDKQRVTLYRIQNQVEKVAEQTLKWELNDGDPIHVSVFSNYDKLQIKLTQRGNSADVNYTSQTPIVLKDITIHNNKGFQLIEEKKPVNGRGDRG